MSDLLLMSIKTKYAREIFNATKKYEFRKRSIGNNNINKKIFIYSSGVDKAIIGYIIVDYILNGDLDYILNKTNNNSDIKNYFKDINNCYALHIKKSYRLDNPITLNELRKIDKNVVVPQYFRYVKENEPLYILLKDF